MRAAVALLVLVAAVVALVAAGGALYLARSTHPAPDAGTAVAETAELDVRVLTDDPERALAAAAELSTSIFPSLVIDGGRAPRLELTREALPKPATEEDGVYPRGLSDADTTHAAKLRTAARLRFALLPGALPELHQAELLVNAVAKRSPSYVWLPSTFELMVPSEWQKRRVESWDGDFPDVARHVMVQVWTNDDGSLGMQTAGLGVFAMHELSVDGLSRSNSRTMNDFLNVLMQQLVERPQPLPGKVYLDLVALRHRAMREDELSGAKENAQKHTHVRLVPAEDESQTLSVVFRDAENEEESVRQEAAFDELFGSEDAYSQVEHSPQVLAASARARKRIHGELRRAFLKGLPYGEVLLLKAPFETSSGGNEWMWVEVTGWGKETIAGTLQNQPDDVPELKAGQAVHIAEKDVFDYILHRADGGTEGNETGELFRKQAARAPH